MRVKKMIRRLLVATCLIGAGLAAAEPVFVDPSATVPVVSTTAVPAHSLDAARTHTPLPPNAWQNDVLARSSQKNWYRLELTSRSYVYALLGSLPANYNLRLYDEAGTVLSKSDRASLRPEKVARTLDPGTYFLRVASTRGSSPRRKYAVLARVVPTSATVGVLTARVDNSGLVVGELVNVSTSPLAVAHVAVSFYGPKGKLLRRYGNSGVVNRLWIPMAPGSRAPFTAITSNVPQSVLKKTTRVVVVPRWSVMPTAPAAKLRVSHVKRTNRHHPGWTEVNVTGRFHNSSSRAVPEATAVVEVHDTRGVVIGLEQDSRRVPGHATRTFRTSYFSVTSNPAISVAVFETVSIVPDPE